MVPVVIGVAALFLVFVIIGTIINKKKTVDRMSEMAEREKQRKEM